MKYNIGQMLILARDIELNQGISGASKIKRKGTKMFVGADKERPSFHFLNGDVIMLPKDRKIKGYSANGIAEWLYLWLNNEFPFDDMLEDYEVNGEEFKYVIVEALVELGLYNDKGDIG